jgi:hypothetical protein
MDHTKAGNLLKENVVKPGSTFVRNSENRFSFVENTKGGSSMYSEEEQITVSGETKTIRRTGLGRFGSFFFQLLYSGIVIFIRRRSQNKHRHGGELLQKGLESIVLIASNFPKKSNTFSKWINTYRLANGIANKVLPCLNIRRYTICFDRIIDDRRQN